MSIEDADTVVAGEDAQNQTVGSGPELTPHQQLVVLWARVRGDSMRLTAPLNAEDQQVQSMADVSPTKWHLAHTTWFFEQFILKALVANYQEFDADYCYLFNSYYEAVGSRHPRTQRGLMTRPSLQQIHRYREHVDQALASVLGSSNVAPEVSRRLLLGLNHEQQHQELMLSDIQHVLSLNSLAPSYRQDWPGPQRRDGESTWVAVDVGEGEIGHQGDGFAFDNEGPRHRVLATPFEIASALVSEHDWLAFMEGGGYQQAQWWMADGWARVQAESWIAPEYWRRKDGQWVVFGLNGEQALDPQRPVSHISWYEADAFARWSNARLPTEQEWELAAADPDVAGQLQQLRTALWQWTGSAYSAYPRFRPSAGALGEYNGKFMCNQFVLRGGAHATPDGHSRVSYRNFYYPHQRWQFAGLRLARDVAVA